MAQLAGYVVNEHAAAAAACLSGVQQSEVIEQALSIKASCGHWLFDCVQATWNLPVQSAGAPRCSVHQPMVTAHGACQAGAPSASIARPEGRDSGSNIALS